MHNGERREPFADMRQGFDVAGWVADVVAFPVVLCTTRLGTWGSHFLGIHAVLGFFWPLVLGGLYETREPAWPMFAFWVASIVLLLAHRMEGIRRRRRGERCHSRYWGVSWFEGTSSQWAARMKVSGLAIAVGLAVGRLLHGPLGALLVVGGVGKWLSDTMAFQAVEARIRRMEDLRIENQFYLDLYRERYGSE